MKINLVSFNCQFDECIKNVALFPVDDLKFFLAINDLSVRDFNPDFVNESMDQFVFCTDNKEWKEFVSLFYDKSGVNIILDEIPTPEDFDIYQFFNCNVYIIEYIANPEYRNKAFLMQATENIGNKYFIDKMHGILKHPIKSNIFTFQQLRMLWNKLRWDSHLGSFLTRRQSFLTRISNLFPTAYYSFYFKFIASSKIISFSHKMEYVHCSDELLKAFDEQELELPF